MSCRKEHCVHRRSRQRVRSAVGRPVDALVIALADWGSDTASLTSFQYHFFWQQKDGSTFMHHGRFWRVRITRTKPSSRQTGLDSAWSRLSHNWYLFHVVTSAMHIVEFYLLRWTIHDSVCITCSARLTSTRSVLRCPGFMVSSTSLNEASTTLNLNHCHDIIEIGLKVIVVYVKNFSWKWVERKAS